MYMCRWNEWSTLPHEKIENLAHSYYVINYVLRIFQFGECCKTVRSHTSQCSICEHDEKKGICGVAKTKTTATQVIKEKNWAMRHQNISHTRVRNEWFVIYLTTQQRMHSLSKSALKMNRKLVVGRGFFFFLLPPGRYIFDGRDHTMRFWRTANFFYFQHYMKCKGHCFVFFSTTQQHF